MVLLCSGCGIGIVGKALLEYPAPAAVVAFAQARCSLAEFFPAGMRELDPGPAIIRCEADLDQLLLFGREPDDPRKGQTMRRLIGQHGSPRGFAPICGSFEDAPAYSRLDRTVYGSGPVWVCASGHQRAISPAKN